MGQGNVFGSAQLTPELLRGASFDERDGRVDVDEVRAFLSQVASALEVLQASDAQQALKAEWSRNAKIAEQVLDAGQTAAEQLRTHAASEARRILEETREATLVLRETVEHEIEQSRTQVVEMRAQFIQDLRDLYDRIGASLYRFERAAEESRVEPISVPAPAPAPAPVPVAVPEPVTDPAPTPEPDVPAAVASFSLEDSSPQVAEEAAPAPAWTQLPPEAWGGAPDAIGEPEPEAQPEVAAEPQPTESFSLDLASDPFAVVEDEPLAPGEPLVDLRTFGTDGVTLDQGEPAVEVERPDDDLGGSWLEPAQAEVVVPAEPAEPVADLGGSWLEDANANAPGPEPATPDVSRDDALAEALIAGSPFDAPAPTPVPLTGAPFQSAEPSVPTAEPPVQDMSTDAAGIRQLVLDSLAAGQPRETVEAFLREHYGMLAPESVVNAALGTTPQPPEGEQPVG